MSKQRASQLVEAAVWLEATGDLAGARKLYEQALKMDPANARALRALERDHAREPKPEPKPKPEAAPPEPRATAIQYPETEEPDTLPPVDPDLEEAATVIDTTLHLAQADASTHPTLPELRAPAEPPGLKRKPAPGRSAKPTPASVPRELSLQLPPAPRPDPLTPPPPRPPPHGATPPPRNAWESDGTPPGLDLVVTTIPPRAGPRDAMDLLSDAPPRATPPPIRRPENVRQEVESLIKGARDLLELDDHTGAMDLIEKAAVLAPDDLMVQRLKLNSEVVLQSMYESKLGRLDARPRLLLRPDEIIWLNLDHRAGFVLAQIDGSVSYEDLFAICGMSRLDTLRILSQLVGAGVISGVSP